MPRFPIGDMVRDQWGKLGQVVRVPQIMRMRGYTPVQFDGAERPLLVRSSMLKPLAHNDPVFLTERDIDAMRGRHWSRRGR